MKRKFYYLIRKGFQNDEEWRLFYCDSTLGCRVIQEFDVCKLDDFWCGEYRHYTAQAQESVLNSEATNKAFLGKQRSGTEYVAMVTS